MKPQARISCIRMFRSIILAGAALSCTGAMAANTNTWDSTAADGTSWQTAARYVERREPMAGDVVVIPANCHAVVPETDVDFVGGLLKIVMMSNASVEFDVENDHEVTCEIRQDESNNSSWSAGTLLKKSGSGTLTLSAPYTRNGYMYRTGMEVSGGCLRLGDVAEYASQDNYLSIVRLTVGADGIFDLNGAGKVNIGRLTGAGVISNGVDKIATYLNMARDDQILEFSGKLLGNIDFKASANGTRLTLSGEESDFSIFRVYYDGVVALSKFGNAGELSSIGTNGVVQLVNGGSLEYLGDVDTTDKDIAFKGNNETPAKIDAGANGGVTFTGRFGYHTGARVMRKLVISGSNDNECVISGPWYEQSPLNGTNFATYITKEGSGIWRFADNAARNHRGVTAVKGGTLRFDSVAEAGEMCSLGLSTVLHDDLYDTVRRDKNAVPYALLIGSEELEGTLEYTGSTDAWCTTRPIGVKGSARLRNATNHDFLWRNVFGVGGSEGKNVLTLDGDSTTADNRLENVTNACGTLSVVKDGLGSWTLAGDVAFNGSLEVKKGTLTILRDRTTPTWFRWNIMQNFAQYENDYEGGRGGKMNKKGDSYAIQVDEFALYSADGVRRNKHLTAADDWTALAGGQAALQQGAYGTPGDGNRDVSAIFSDTPASSKYGFFKSDQGDTWMAPQYTNSWIRIVMRLADDSAPIVSYDYANLNGANRPCVYAYSIESSFNGREWTVLTNVTSRPRTDYEKKWESKGDTIAADQVRPFPDYGFPLDVPVRSPRCETISSVSVASGATFRADIRDGGAVTVAGLSLDSTAGVGTFENITFAENGTVDVVNVPRTGAEFSPVLVNCEGFSNVANWSVTKNGRSINSLTMDVYGGKIRIVPAGSVIVIK